MTSKEGYFEDICNRYINWFDGFIGKAKEAVARGLMEEKEGRKGGEKKVKPNKNTRTEPKEKLELTGTGLAINIEDLTFDSETFGITLSIYLDVKTEKLGELGKSIRRMREAGGIEEETPEEMYRRMYEELWKITIEGE